MQQPLFDVERHLMNHPWRDFAHPAREFFQLLGRQVLGPGLPYVAGVMWPTVEGPHHASPASAIEASSAAAATKLGG
jgi:hypothetical protein